MMINLIKLNIIISDAIIVTELLPVLIILFLLKTAPEKQQPGVTDAVGVRTSGGELRLRPSTSTSFSTLCTYTRQRPVT